MNGGLVSYFMICEFPILYFSNTLLFQSSPVTICYSTVIYSSSFFISFHWNFLFLCIFLLKKFGIYFLSSNSITNNLSYQNLLSNFSRNYFCIHNPLIRLSLCVSFTFFISIWSLVTLLMISSNKDVRASTS